MTTHPPARIPCGVMYDPDCHTHCGEMNGLLLCDNCKSALLAHYSAAPPSDPAKHAEAVAETARKLIADMDAGMPEESPYYRPDWKCRDIEARAGDRRRVYGAVILRSLDSLPGDGGELAEAEWLEANGWRRDGKRNWWRNQDFQKLQFASGSSSIWMIDSDSAIVVIEKPTRSQVRHLLAALTPATGGE